MKKEEFIVVMKYLSTAYNKELTEEQCGVWYDVFKDDDMNLLKKAIKRIVISKEFMPSIAEIKKEIATISNPILELDAEEEWENVRYSIRKYGSYREQEALKSLNSYTRKIVEMIGFYKICTSESIQWEKKNFIELFNGNKENNELILATNEKYLTMNELLKKEKYQIKF